MRMFKQRCCCQAGEEGGGGRRPTAAQELGGSALRLLHQLAHATTAAEALSRASTPAVPTLLAATRWANPRSC